MRRGLRWEIPELERGGRRRRRKGGGWCLRREGLKKDGQTEIEIDKFVCEKDGEK